MHKDSQKHHGDNGAKETQGTVSKLVEKGSNAGDYRASVCVNGLVKLAKKAVFRRPRRKPNDESEKPRLPSLGDNLKPTPKCRPKPCTHRASSPGDHTRIGPEQPLPRKGMARKRQPRVGQVRAHTRPVGSDVGAPCGRRSMRAIATVRDTAMVDGPGAARGRCAGDDRGRSGGAGAGYSG